MTIETSEQVRLECPKCRSWGFDGIEQVTLFPDNDAYESPAGTRGEWLQFPTRCESCDTRYLLCIGNHKGDILIDLVEAV